jgi:hypothetical protein
MDCELKIGQYLVGLDFSCLETVLCVQRISNEKVIFIIDNILEENEGKIKEYDQFYAFFATLSLSSRVVCNSPDEAFQKVIDKSKVRMSNDLSKWTLQINLK